MILAPLWANLLAIVTAVAFFHYEQYFAEGGQKSRFGSWIFSFAMLGGLFGPFAFMAWYWALPTIVACSVLGGVVSVYILTFARPLQWAGPIALFGSWGAQYYEFFRES